MNLLSRSLQRLPAPLPSPAETSGRDIIREKMKIVCAKPGGLLALRQELRLSSVALRQFMAGDDNAITRWKIRAAAGYLCHVVWNSATDRLINPSNENATPLGRGPRPYVRRVTPPGERA
jgi:hypothetical protein